MKFITFVLYRKPWVQIYQTIFKRIITKKSLQMVETGPAAGLGVHMCAPWPPGQTERSGAALSLSLSCFFSKVKRRNKKETG